MATDFQDRNERRILLAKWFGKRRGWSGGRGGWVYCTPYTVHGWLAVYYRFKSDIWRELYSSCEDCGGYLLGFEVLGRRCNACLSRAAAEPHEACFSDYWDALDVFLRAFYGVDSMDMGVSADEIAEAEEAGESAREFAESLGRKYDLTFLAEIGIKLPE